MEIDALELTERQSQALDGADATPLRLVNPATRERFVLVREAEYERLTDDGHDYDDTGITQEEMMALAWEAGARAGWEDMDEYDDLPEKP